MTTQDEQGNPAGMKLLIFVVAYNAEDTLARVLDRIPAAVWAMGADVLVIDDASSDCTFATGMTYEAHRPDRRIRVLRAPENQGYGGNQKLGYRYAIENGYDVVALLHGDGQYAPERLPMLLEPVTTGQADAVFGSRMMEPGAARKGGMPLYKYVGNRILTAIENRLLGTALTEFHSGYRVYAVSALRRIPFERNTNDFHFDTEIIVQLVLAELRIRELPIPTYYGNEICHVNGLAYALHVVSAVLHAQAHRMALLYDRKYDVGQPELRYTLKLGYRSSHTVAIAFADGASHVLDLGCGPALVASELARRGIRVTGIDRDSAGPIPEDARLTLVRGDLDSCDLPVDAAAFDTILMLDVIEHLRDPERFMETLQTRLDGRRARILITTPNIGFFMVRFGLLAGQFNYGRKGILDRTHTRLFTFRSLRRLLEQCGYTVKRMGGLPAPYPEALGMTRLSRLLVRLNALLLRVWPGMFAYQIRAEAEAKPSLRYLLRETEASRLLQDHESP